ncbi:glutamate racemase [Rhizosaccharibacter radicis]|uniref:glutamate racemase n=1 Tax=Rhizosaccharibacter radicis TaxID=2782605 RepID=UPI003BF5E1FF
MTRLLAFDSGIGGLGIVRELRRQLPDVPVDYLADTALFPYGEVPDHLLVPRIVSLVEAAIRRFEPDAVVVACNTASTLALGALRERIALPVVGCVPPIKWAAERSRTRHIGLLATSATVRRAYLHELRERFAPDCTLVAHGARHLADVAERVFRGAAPDEALVRRELRLLFDQPGGERVDVVGIGCTHYSFLLEPLRRLSPPGTLWLDPAEAVARRAAAVLAAAGHAVPAGGGEGGPAGRDGGDQHVRGDAGRNEAPDTAANGAAGSRAGAAPRTGGGSATEHGPRSGGTRPGHTGNAHRPPAGSDAAGRAWFTAEPPERDAVRAGLEAYGYRELEPFSVPG